MNNIIEYRCSVFNADLLSNYYVNTLDIGNILTKVELRSLIFLFFILILDVVLCNSLEEALEEDYGAEFELILDMLSILSSMLID